MARYKIDCCKDCPNRSGECHGICPEYKKQRAELDETMYEKRKQKEADKSLTEANFDYRHRTTKRYVYRGKYRRWH